MEHVSRVKSLLWYFSYCLTAGCMHLMEGSCLKSWTSWEQQAQGYSGLQPASPNPPQLCGWALTLLPVRGSVARPSARASGTHWVDLMAWWGCSSVALQGLAGFWTAPGGLIAWGWGSSFTAPKSQRVGLGAAGCPISSHCGVSAGQDPILWGK